MEPQALDFLQQILQTPSPSGYERPVQDLVRQYVGEFSDEVTTDVHGNVIACANPGGSLRVMFAGHCDQIGLLVTHIDDNGFLYTQTIGGWDPPGRQPSNEQTAEQESVSHAIIPFLHRVYPRTKRSASTAERRTVGSMGISARRIVKIEKTGKIGAIYRVDRVRR